MLIETYYFRGLTTDLVKASLFFDNTQLIVDKYRQSFSCLVYSHLW